MTETMPASETAEQQKTAAAFIGSVLNSGADPLLKAQADFLVSAETTVSDWLRRRHEAVVDAQHLVARLRTSRDPFEVLKVQQDWISGSFRRLAADAAAYQSATQQLVDRARSWFPQTLEGEESVASKAAAATRAAGKPFRMANKSD